MRTFMKSIYVADKTTATKTITVTKRWVEQCRLQMTHETVKMTSVAIDISLE